MPLITLFSAPKPFTNPHIAMIQRNAICSWTLLPDVEVILLGEETGLAEAARELGVKHIPNVARSANGTPLVSSMFNLAREQNSSPLLCIINADIILFPDFVEAAKQSMKLRDKFVLMGRRWDLDLTRPIEFTKDWEYQLQTIVHSQGTLHRPAGSDYFLFPRVCYEDIPDFAIGRAGWDNWMIYKARKEGWATVDATPSIMIVHQNHDYSHLPGGQPHYKHPETDVNIQLAGGREVTRFTLLDADCRLSNGRLIPREWNLRTFRRALETYPLLAWGNAGLAAKVSALFRRFRSKTRKRS
ncbi:MAG: hypothetical protein HXY35_16740 [Chloroflexi bacterium]|nr:hypothetical protein [Chloroflexota bacterium]